MMSRTEKAPTTLRGERLDMKTRKTAKGTLQITEIGFGGSAIGNLYHAEAEENAIAAVEAAWGGGIRYFDTAPHYGLGLSESRLGRALGSKPRSEYVLSTKVGRLLVPHTTSIADNQEFEVTSHFRREWNFSRDGVLRSIEGSLRRLNTDRIDIVYIHDPDEHWQVALDGAVPTLAQLRSEGAIHAFGVGMSHSGMLARFALETDIDVVMLAGRLTLLDHSAVTDLIPAVRMRDVDIVAAGVFNSGLLAHLWPPIGAKYDYHTAPDHLLQKARRLANLCDLQRTTLPAAAIAFPLRFGEVACCVLGMRNATEVHENLQRYAIGVPPEFWKQYDARKDASD
jgi:D-threo-aldose 1-dehydrogenase